jgi:hypothetical protein
MTSGDRLLLMVPGPGDGAGEQEGVGDGAGGAGGATGEFQCSSRGCRWRLLRARREQELVAYGGFGQEQEPALGWVADVLVVRWGWAMAEPLTMSTREGAPEQAVDLGVEAHPQVVVGGGGASSSSWGW